MEQQQHDGARSRSPRPWRKNRAVGSQPEQPIQRDNAHDKDPKTGRFKTGNNGGGRPRGSRNKLGEAFVTDLFEDWQKHGKSVIAFARAEDPVAYLKVVASVLPKQLD